MKPKYTSHPAGLRGQTQGTRMAHRPTRLPGVAPACEDAREPVVRPITLPRVNWLEKSR